MTLVNIDLRNQGYETEPDDRVIFYSLLVREGDFGTISTAPVEVELVEGKASVDLAPGPVGVQIVARQVADTRVKIGEVPPSGPTTLGAVMTVTPAYTPALQKMMIAAIERAKEIAVGQVDGAVSLAIDAEVGEFKTKAEQALARSTAAASKSDAALSKSTTAESSAGNAVSRVSALEAMSGLSPESPVDGQTANLIGQPDTLTRKALEAISKTYAASVSVKEFGAVGDGIADDTTALEEALASGKPIELVGGETYRITSMIQHTGDVTMFCHGRATIRQDQQNFSALYFQGEQVASTTLSAGKEIGDAYWRVSDVAGVEPGMLMEVISDKSWYYDPRPDSTDARKSELHRVAEISNGRVVTELQSNDGYPADENVEVHFYRPAKVLLENITIEAELVTDGSPVRRGLIIETVADSEINNVNVINYGLTAINARRAYRSIVRGGDMVNVNGAGSSYAIQTWGCTLFDITETHFRGCYSGIDFSGMNVISFMCSVTETVLSGGGTDAEGNPLGWGEYTSLGKFQRGHGAHGPSDRCVFSDNRISGVQAAFALRGRNHIVSRNVIESRSANGAIRIYGGYNFTIEGNVCDRSFFGGKDTAAQSWSSSQDKLARSFILVMGTYHSDGDGPLVVRGNKAQVNRDMIQLQGDTHPSPLVVVYEDNTAIFAPKDRTSGVYVFNSDSPQAISNRSHISVGDVRFSEYNTTFLPIRERISINSGARLSDLSVRGSEWVEMIGGWGQSGAYVGNCAITFHGENATVAFAIHGINVDVDEGSDYSIRIRPYLYGETGGSSSNTFGVCGSVATVGTVQHFTTSSQGDCIQLNLRSVAQNASTVTGTATYRVGSPSTT